MQRRAAEQQHGGDHGLRAAVGDDGARDHRGDRAVDDFGHRGPAHLAEVLAHAVEHHHRLVHRVAEHREHRGQHRQREFPLEQGKAAEDDHHVVQVCDDRREAEAPFEAQPQVEHDAHRGDDERDGASLVEFLADLRADELDPPYLGAGVLCLEQCSHLLRQLGSGLVLFDRQADQHVARGAEVLHLALETGLVERLADLLDVGGLLVIDLDQRAAGELDRKVQALVGQEEHRGEEGQQGDDVEDERMPHERDDAADLEEFHALLHFQAVLPIARLATLRRCP